MKRLTIILSMIAAPAFADGPSQYARPEVTPPVCVTSIFNVIIWKGKCNASRGPSPDSRDVVPVGGPDNTTPDKQPERRPERDKPTDTPSGQIGQPGNDKPVGRAGEKPEKGMDERSPAGNRGKSN